MADIQIKWRERDLGTLRMEIQADHRVRHALDRFGVLKFVENPLMRAREPLLAQIISYWDPDHEVLIVQGHRIELTVQDLYFLTGLPPLGMVGNTQRVLPRGVTSWSFLSDIVDQVFESKGLRYRLEI